MAPRSASGRGCVKTRIRSVSGVPKPLQFQTNQIQGVLRVDVADSSFCSTFLHSLGQEWPLELKSRKADTSNCLYELDAAARVDIQRTRCPRRRLPIPQTNRQPEIGYRPSVRSHRAQTRRFSTGYRTRKWAHVRLVVRGVTVWRTVSVGGKQMNAATLGVCASSIVERHVERLQTGIAQVARAVF